MTATAADHLLEATTTPVVAVKRRTIDAVLVGLGAVVTVVLVVAGGLLSWGANFSSDYVHEELSSQNISFPDAAALNGQDRGDLLAYAGATVDSGGEAEAYASYIDGHLAAVADGRTYAELGGPERAARAAVGAAETDGTTVGDIAVLQAEADAITAQRTTLFQGETLRGLLLSAYAWSTVGRIAGIAAIGAFLAAAAMAVLVGLGARHHQRAAVA